MVQKAFHCCIDNNVHRKYDKQCIRCATFEFVLNMRVGFR